MLLDTIVPVGTPDAANGRGFETTATGPRGFATRARATRPSDGAAKRVETPRPAADGPWIACDDATGVVEVHDPRVLRRGHEAFCRALVRAAVVRSGALLAEVSLETATCRLAFGAGRLDREEMARRVASAVREATPAIRQGAGRPDDGGGLSCLAGVDAVPMPIDGELFSDDPPSADDAPTGRRRLVHLAMAGGSLTLAAAAVILPGLPTLPFLIMTGRHAALVSPRVERMLKRYPWCAALLAEAETSSGSSIEWGSLLKMLALAILFAVGIWIFQPPLPVILCLELGLMLFLGLREWLGSDLAEIGLEVIA